MSDQNSTQSSDDDRPFDGFTITDQRPFLKEAEQKTLYKCISLKRRSSFGQPEQDLLNDNKDVPTKQRMGTAATLATSDFEIEGEESWYESCMQQRLPVSIVTSCGMATSHSESEIEGEEAIYDFGNRLEEKYEEIVDIQEEDISSLSSSIEGEETFTELSSTAFEADAFEGGNNTECEIQTAKVKKIRGKTNY